MTQSLLLRIRALTPHALPASSTLSLRARLSFHNTRLAEKSSPFLAETGVSWGSPMCGTRTPSAPSLLAIADEPWLGVRLVGCLYKPAKFRGQKQLKWQPKNGGGSYGSPHRDMMEVP